MASKSNLSVVIDIGTSKIVALAGQRNELGKLEVLGVSKVPSKGIKRGVVFNIDEAAHSINEALAQLEPQLEEEIKKVNVAYAGQYMKTIDYQNSKFTSDEGIVSAFDIENLYNKAKELELEQDYEIIQVIPTSYKIDGEITDLKVTGITGREIIANYKLVIIPKNYLKNLQHVFDKTNFEMGEIILSTLAVSEAVITEEEKELGAIVFDIGAGTANLAIFQNNMLVHSAVIPFGGNVVTKDIKEGCSILLKLAERMKNKYGEALGDFADDQKVVTIPVRNGFEPKEISFRSLAYIIQARLDEIMDIVNLEIEKSGIINQLSAGIVLTGGTANLNNFVSLVKFRTGMDVRKANLALHLKGKKGDLLDTENLTALGLLNLVTDKSAISVQKTQKKPKKKNDSKIMPFVGKFVQTALGLFDDDNEDMLLN